MFDPTRDTVFSRSSVFGILLLSIGFASALLIPVAAGAGNLTGSRVSAVLILSLLSVCAGRTVSLAVRLPKETGFISSFEIVAGFAALSVLHLMATALVNLDAGRAVLFDAVTVGVVCTVLHTIRSGSRCPGSGRPGSDDYQLRSTAIDAGMLLLISAVVTFWAREALVSVREAQTTGVFRVWNDFLLQAAEIRYLEGYPAFARQSLYLADAPQTFYHRASYALSAAYSWISGDPALETATYFWLPTGIILMGMAAYGLGCALAGRAAGIASAAALFLLPDASMYWLGNGYFAFHWLIQVAPGSGYAISLGLVALAVYSLGARYSRYSLVLAGAVPVLASTLFRTHIAIPMVVLYLILALAAWRPARPRHRTIAVAVLLLLGLLTVLIFERVALAPHFLTGRRDWLRYIEAVHAAVPIPYEGLYLKLTAGTRMLWKAIVGYLLMLPAEYGALLPLMVLALYLKRRLLSIDWRSDRIPFLLLAVHTAIIFLMPTPRHGDITDWSHRSFVLVYAVLLIFTVAWMTSLCKAAIPDGATMRALGWAAGLLVVTAGVSVPWLYGKNIQYGSLRDGPTACATAISGDMFKAARFIREHSRTGEKMLTSDNDPVALAVSLTGLQAYLSRKALYQTLGGDLGKLATARSAAHDGLRRSLTFEELAAFGTSNNIRWYLLRREDMPDWPRKLLDRSVYSSGSLYVFDLRP